MKQTLWFVGAALVMVGACAEADRPASDLPSEPGVFFAKPPANACSFRDAKSYSDDYFTTVADRKTAADYLKAAEGATGLARNTEFFNLFAFMPQKRNAQQVNAASAGAKLVLEARDCGSLTISHDDGFIEAVLTEALSTGAFAYRAGTEGYVATYDGGSALWTANWNTWIGGRSVAFGARWATGFGTEALVGTASYRWGVIYDATSTGPHGDGNDDIAVVELCEAGVQYELDAKNRVGRVRSGGGKTVLQVGDIGGFCDGPFPESGGLVSRVLRGIHGFFAPTPLQARRRPPGIGGGIDELSDFLGVNALSVNLTFTTQPATGLATQPFLVVVRAATAANNDFENVPVTVAVANNQGSPAGAFLTAETGCPGFSGTSALTQVTNELGLATFCVKVNKPGGYILEASHSLNGFDPNPKLSDQFNRTGG